MIRLIGCTYHYGYNVIVSKCDSCREVGFHIMQQPLKIKCRCTSAEFDRLPLYFLKYNKPIMTIFKMTNLKNGKKFIGVSFQGSEKVSKSEYEKRIINKEIQTIVKYEEAPELKQDIRELGLDCFNIEVIAYPTTFSETIVDQQLLIEKFNAMEPTGYNTEKYMVENRLGKIG